MVVLVMMRWLLVNSAHRQYEVAVGLRTLLSIAKIIDGPQDT